jgi:hypothetical protein
VIRLNSIRGYPVFGTMLALGSVAGMWRSASRAELLIRDQNDAALARHAAAYIAVVTPGAPGLGFDARRLVSSANTIASASFWRGGFQMALGSAALVADTIRLLPLPDSLSRLLEAGASGVVSTSGRYRVSLVPFRSGPDQPPLGWAAAWNTIPSRTTTPFSIICSLLAVAGIIAAGLTWARRTRPAWGLLATAIGFGLLALLAIILGVGVQLTARSSTAVRLLTARRLIEIAATANGVRPARLNEIAAGLQVRELTPPVTPIDDIARRDSPSGPIAFTIAATPRTQGGLELRLAPVETGLGSLWRTLLLWLGLGGVGVAFAAGAAGLSAASGLFHSAGSGPEPPSDGGHQGA